MALKVNDLAADAVAVVKNCCPCRKILDRMTEFTESDSMKSADFVHFVILSKIFLQHLLRIFNH